MVPQRHPPVAGPLRQQGFRSRVDVRPECAIEVAAVLAQYLAEYLGISDLSYRQAPVQFPEGWETYSYAFQLDSPERLPPPFARPLVLRIYASVEGLPRARYEWAVQKHLLQLGYPVTAPLHLGDDERVFGGPFLLREQALGHTLLHDTLRKPWRLAWAPAAMAGAHLHLHRLPVAGFPAPPGSLLDRTLDEMAATCHRYHFAEMLPGLDWLQAHRPAPADAASILHLDFHPMNLIDQAGRPLTVLDWTEADVGDSHADVATTLMLMECVPGHQPSIRDRVSVWVGRHFFTRWYLAAYRAERQLDGPRLDYFRAWAALGRLCRYGRWLCGGPAATGSKPSLPHRLGAEHIGTLENYFRRWTGVRCCLAQSFAVAATCLS